MNSQTRFMQEQNSNFKDEVRLTHDRVLIQPIEEDKTHGGIYIPESAREKPCFGLVVAVGPGRRDEKTGIRKPMMSKVGDTIVYDRTHGLDVPLVSGKYLVINDFEVMGVLRDDD